MKPLALMMITAASSLLASGVRGGRLQSALDYLHAHESFPKLMVPDGMDAKLDAEVDRLMVNLFGRKNPLGQIYYNDDDDEGDSGSSS